jgi:transcriptional regulator with PAS, ATPase and Fis domain
LDIKEEKRMASKIDNAEDKIREEELLTSIPQDLLMALLDNPYESMILIDSHGIVRSMSRANDGIYLLSPEDAIGRHISEVSPGTEMLRVLETGKAEIGRSMLLNNQWRVVARIPLSWGNRIVGVVGKLMFMSHDKLKSLYQRIDTLEQNLDFYKEELNALNGSRYTFDSIIGDSELIQQAKTLALQAAENDVPVIIVGESGTGKELFAHSIHRASPRAGSNFVRVNCAAIPHDLIEAELFGYEEGAFTGANKKGKPGKFELADKGTIFLDEIGDMPSDVQVKLMRVLQEKEVERIGGRGPKPVDFRLISATNQTLEKMIGTGMFRLDLYYRLNVISIHLPPLRTIPEDIPLIFKHVMKSLNETRKQPVHHVSAPALEAIGNYPWPGNVRELRNVVERAMIVCKEGRIELADLPISVRETPPHKTPAAAGTSSLKEILDSAERKAVMSALESCDNNRVRAAALLGIHRTGLYQKMKKYGIG